MKKTVNSPNSDDNSASIEPIPKDQSTADKLEFYKEAWEEAAAKNKYLQQRYDEKIEYLHSKKSYIIFVEKLKPFGIEYLVEAVNKTSSSSKQRFLLGCTRNLYRSPFLSRLKRKLKKKLKSLIVKSTYKAIPFIKQKSKTPALKSKILKLQDEIHHFKTIEIRGRFNQSFQPTGKFLVKEKLSQTTVNIEITNKSKKNTFFKLNHTLTTLPFSEIILESLERDGETRQVGVPLRVWCTEPMPSTAIHLVPIQLDQENKQVTILKDIELKSVKLYQGSFVQEKSLEKKSQFDFKEIDTNRPYYFELTSLEAPPVVITPHLGKASPSVHKLEFETWDRQVHTEEKPIAPMNIIFKDGEPIFNVTTKRFNIDNWKPFSAPIIFDCKQKRPFSCSNASRVTVIRKAESPTDYLYFQSAITKEDLNCELRFINLDDIENGDNANEIEFIKDELVIVIRYISNDLLKTLYKKTKILQSLVFLMDDDISSALDSHQLGKKYRNKLIDSLSAHFLNLYNLADWVIFTSDFLYNKFNTPKTLKLLPYLGKQNQLKQQTNNITKISFIGTEGHELDLKFITPALIEILQTENVQIDIIGFKNVIKPLLQFDQVTFIKPMTWDKFDDFISKYTTDILIVPLLPFPYNFGKSFIKILDAARYGAVPVMSKRLEYQKYINNGEDGLLIDDDPNLWKQNLKFLIQNPIERKRISKNCRSLADRISSAKNVQDFWGVSK